MPYPRGFVLGGSSSISELVGDFILLGILTGCNPDYMAFTRGSKDEFNHFASVSGNPIWNWDNIFPYALKVSLYI